VKEERKGRLGNTVAGLTVVQNRKTAEARHVISVNRKSGNTEICKKKDLRIGGKGEQRESGGGLIFSNTVKKKEIQGQKMK